MRGPSSDLQFGLWDSCGSARMGGFCRLVDLVFFAHLPKECGWSFGCFDGGFFCFVVDFGHVLPGSQQICCPGDLVETPVDCAGFQYARLCQVQLNHTELAIRVSWSVRTGWGGLVG